MYYEDDNTDNTIYYCPDTRSYNFGNSLLCQKANKLAKEETKMKKFKTGDKIVRTSVPTAGSPLGSTTIVTATYEYIDNGGTALRIVDAYWELASTTSKPIKSNGGSSAYYTLVINDQTVETEDVIRDVFANDFDFGNAFKSLVRAYGALNGAGKDGNTVDYEMNKLRYSSKKIERQNG